MCKPDYVQLTLAPFIFIIMNVYVLVGFVSWWHLKNSDVLGKMGIVLCNICAGHYADSFTSISSFNLHNPLLGQVRWFHFIEKLIKGE